VQLPGVEDKDRALALVGTTAELRFRPVLSALPLESSTTTTTTAPGATTTTAPGATTTSAATTTTTTTSTTTTTTPPTTTTAATGATTTTTPGSTSPSTSNDECKPVDVSQGAAVPTTSSDDDKPNCTVVLPEYDRKTNKIIGRWVLGPAQLTGSALSSAQAQYQAAQGWYVAVEFKGGDKGTDQLNALATSCRSGDASCPAQRMGITLDSRVVFAGTIASTEATPFPDGKVSITGGYDSKAAKDVALALRYGALPVQLEPKTTQTVSATLGNDAKNAGITAGIVGLALVSVYVLFYYRLLGAVALVSLLLSAGLLWSVISYLSETRGLALTLAGITGLIVSIGVSLDSNIVYFEHMKEDIRNGRTPRSASERSFKGALSTVIKADVASLIGAGALYFLTVGAVRGFAFYLGLAMVLDLAATYFFLGPAVQLLARRAVFSERPTRFGLPARSATPPGGAVGPQGARS
jgi:preprotein translocase subunit SecD